MIPSEFSTHPSQGREKPAVGNSRTVPATGPRRAPVYTFSFAEDERLGAELVVMECVSAGPFTEIYRVWSERRLTAFACKLLRPDLDESDPHRRALATERTVLRRVRHPNVVRLFESDPELELEHVLIEHLGGPSLLDLLAAAPRRRLKPQVALRIAVGVGAALEAVHAAGYLYRDLKPANVLMRDEAPILVDFGAAYRYTPGRRPSARVGTDPYMAPEQVLREPLSPRTDVFGLGALAFEMLTGEWPYEDQLMNVFDRTKLHNRFPQLAHAPGTLRRRFGDMGADIEEVVHRCLARDPADRYASPAAAVADFNRLLATEDKVFPSVDGTGRAA